MRVWEMGTEFLVLLTLWISVATERWYKYRLVFEIHKWRLRFHHMNNFQHIAVLERTTKSTATMLFQTCSVFCVHYNRIDHKRFNPLCYAFCKFSLLSQQYLICCNVISLLAALFTTAWSADWILHFFVCFFFLSAVFLSLIIFFSHFWILSNWFASLQVCCPKVDLN